jgi:inward rectifier potassium channel
MTLRRKRRVAACGPLRHLLAIAANLRHDGLMARTATREPRVGRGYIPAMSGEGRTEVSYVGRPRDGWRDVYHHLLTMPLWAFFGVMAAVYLGVNALFALAYLTVGGVDNMRPGDFPSAFFFSVETFGTIGYGELAPRGVGAHLLVAAESFVSIFNLAVATGLLFARISRPTARVLFSNRAVVTQHDGQQMLIFRAANQRLNRIVEAEVSVTLVHDVPTREGSPIRRFDTLPTVRSRTPVFMLSWQIMHPIDELSPLLGETSESLAARNAQIIVVLKGLDETFAQTIHARGGYTPDQIIWGGRFVDIIGRDEAGRPVIDYAHFHDIA